MKNFQSLAENKLVQIILGVGGIYYCFLNFGLLQEKLFISKLIILPILISFSHNYSKQPNGPKFQSAFSLVFLMSLFSYIISTIIHKFINTNSLQMDQIEQSKFGFFNAASMISSNSALTLVSFPIQALVKSSKILSVMLVSFIFGGKRHELAQYLNATLISLGIFIYNFYGGKKGSNTSSSIFGILLLLFSLIADGLLADKQHTLFEQFSKNNKRFNQFALMKYTTKYTFIFCLIYGTVTLQIQEFINFALQYPDVINDIVMFAIMGAFGQICIYYTISCFGPIILSFVTTSRKFFTVILSLIYYKHQTNNVQKFAIFLAFFGIIFEFVQNTMKNLRKKQNQQKNGIKKS